MSFVSFEELPKRALDLGCGVCDQCYTQYWAYIDELDIRLVFG